MLAAIAIAALGCGDDASAPDPVCDQPTVFEKSPGDVLEGAGWHRLYVQGSSATPEPGGGFTMSEHRNMVLDGDHFMLSAGTLVEFTHPVVGTLSGDIFAHIARVDDNDGTVVGRYELFAIRGGQATELWATEDQDRGEMGYIPYETCLMAAGAPVEFADGDQLLVRVTNISGGTLGIVVNAPDYWTYFDLELQ